MVVRVVLVSEVVDAVGLVDVLLTEVVGGRVFVLDVEVLVVVLVVSVVEAVVLTVALLVPEVEAEVLPVV